MISTTRRRLLAAGALSVAGPLARAKAPPRRVGILISGPTARLQPFISELDSKLRALGFEPGSIVFEGRAADRDESRLVALARELVSTRPEVIQTQGEATTRALLKATHEIPIVATVQDPVAMGFARTLAKPGGQVTGFTYDHAEVAGKQVSVLRTILPRLSRLAVLCKAGGEDERHSLLLSMKASVVAQAALDRRVPLMGPYPFQAEEGFLVTYRMLSDDPVARIARTVAKILRGAKAADLPFEFPDKTQLAVNASTAKALGVVLPPEILVQVDHVFN